MAIHESRIPTLGVGDIPIMKARVQRLRTVENTGGEKEKQNGLFKRSEIRRNRTLQKQGMAIEPDHAWR